MQYKITDSLPIWFVGSIYIYMKDDLFLEAKIKNPLESEKKISDFVFESLKKEFTESKDREVKKARKEWMIWEFVQNMEQIFSDEDIELVLSWFEASDIAK